MKAGNTQHIASRAGAVPVTDKAVKLLATSIFRQLQNEGCQAKDIISISTQLLGLVTHELQRKDEDTGD